MGLDFKNSTLFRKDLSEFGQILIIEVSPFVLSQDLILIGFENKILLGHLEVDENVVGLDVLSQFPHESRVCALSLSPETSISILPNNIIFATGGADFKLRVFKSDLKEDNVCTVLKGHSSYINDTKFDPDNNFIASVSDDNTARLWETENYNCTATFRLTSPGTSVCWHKEDSSKLLVAEKVGLIRFYNVETKTPILSLDYGKPLSKTHWAPSDPQLIASLQLGELLIWDLSKPCVPINNNLLFTEAGGHIKFSPFGELVAAVNNLDCILKVVNVHNNQPKLAVPVTLPSNVSWHSRCPIVCIGEYKTLSFWRVTSK